MKQSNKSSQKGIYIHIPFCVRKCSYCDFFSAIAKKDEIKKYIKYLIKEIELYNIKNEDIYTIFVGGGTPSIMNEEELEYFFTNLKKVVNLENVKEFTFECNPGTLSKSKLEIMKKYNVNRLSIGLQTIQQKNLDFLGRIHNLKEFEESYENARSLGFTNINVDLIYAFHNQSLKDWQETLSYIVNINPEHISAYSLIIEEKTRLYNLLENNKIKEFDEDLFIDMYRYTIEFLKENGYFQYEISNYSKDNYECKHNLLYWDCKEYYGFGPSSSGYISGNRYTNVKSLEKYYENINSANKPIDFEEKLSTYDIFNEKIILGLRKNSGVSLMDLKRVLSERDYEVFLEKLNVKIEERLMFKRKGDIIILTQKGKEISNSIFIDLIF